MQVVNNLTDFFEQALKDLSCRADTKSYLIHLYSDFRSVNNDLSQENLTLLFAKARFNNDFYLYQQIGDYIFFIKTMMPRYFNNTNDYYENIARLSYFSCYRIINKQWPLFEQLADEFRTLECETRKRLYYINI